MRILGKERMIIERRGKITPVAGSCIVISPDKNSFGLRASEHIQITDVAKSQHI
jgi:hypothetical protein